MRIFNTVLNHNLQVKGTEWFLSDRWVKPIRSCCPLFVEMLMTDPFFAITVVEF